MIFLHQTLFNRAIMNSIFNTCDITFSPWNIREVCKKPQKFCMNKLNGTTKVPEVGSGYLLGNTDYS